ncbi:MAG: hypothetical protein WC059_01730 [Candidatus Paceibacterota bacterium]
MIDRKSKVLFILLVLVILASTAASYYKYVIIGDYTIFTDEVIFNESLLAE